MLSIAKDRSAVSQKCVYFIREKVSGTSTTIGPTGLFSLPALQRIRHDCAVLHNHIPANPPVVFGQFI